MPPGGSDGIHPVPSIPGLCLMSRMLESMNVNNVDAGFIIIFIFGGVKSTPLLWPPAEVSHVYQRHILHQAPASDFKQHLNWTCAVPDYVIGSNSAQINLKAVV